MDGHGRPRLPLIFSDDIVYVEEHEIRDIYSEIIAAEENHKGAEAWHEGVHRQANDVLVLKCALQEEGIWDATGSDRPEDSVHVLMEQVNQVKGAWRASQSTRSRAGIYVYLEAVYSLVERWKTKKQRRWNAHRCLRLHSLRIPARMDPLAAVIQCTSDAKCVDRRTRGKWCRALRYAQRKAGDVPLAEFMLGRGGINACASLQAHGRKR